MMFLMVPNFKYIPQLIQRSKKAIFLFGNISNLAPHVCTHAQDSILLLELIVSNDTATKTLIHHQVEFSYKADEGHIEALDVQTKHFRFLLFLNPNKAWKICPNNFIFIVFVPDRYPRIQHTVLLSKHKLNLKSEWNIGNDLE